MLLVLLFSLFLSRNRWHCSCWELRKLLGIINHIVNCDKCFAVPFPAAWPADCHCEAAHPQLLRRHLCSHKGKSLIVLNLINLSLLFCIILTLCSAHKTCFTYIVPVQEFWAVNSPIQLTIIMLVEQIVTSLGSDFKVYLPKLVPHALKVFMHDMSADRAVTAKVSHINS